MAAHFAELSEYELSSLLDEKNAENTKKVTKTAINVCRQSLEAKYLKEDDVLSQVLCRSKRETANFLNA